ncbi:hypothetical protein VTO42DRAFT_7693 [Malbranchea cinnamomea]
MKVTGVALTLAAATLAQAQLDVPKCALSCFLNALSSSSCQDTFDFKCQCAQTGLVDIVVPCVQESCSPEDQQATVDAVTKRCNEVSVPISIPPLDGERPTSAPATEQPTSSGHASEHPSSSAAATTSAPVSSPTEATTSSIPVVTGSFTQPSPTHSAGPTEFPGAGSSIKTNLGAMAAGLLAAAAYL